MTNIVKSCFPRGGVRALPRNRYRGRQCITEFLDLTDEIKEMILDRKPPSEIRKRALYAGMTSLRQAALEKLRQGVTTLAEINRVTFIEQA